MPSRQAGYPQLSTTEVVRLLRKATKAVKDAPDLYQPPSRHPFVIQKHARGTFAEIASADQRLRLRWSKYSIVLGRPDEIPHSNYYFNELLKKPKTKAAVKNLYKAVTKAAGS